MSINCALGEGGKYYQRCKVFKSYKTFQRCPSSAVTKHWAPLKFTRKNEVTNALLNKLELIWPKCTFFHYCDQSAMMHHNWYLPSANQRHSHNIRLHGELNSNCISLLQGLATQLKRELFHFTLLDPESEISLTTRLLLTFAVELKTMINPWTAYTSSSERMLQW